MCLPYACKAPENTNKWIWELHGYNGYMVTATHFNILEKCKRLK